mmetsp:Transcript_7780/g.18511  ORF Transcript_7780/g.18511 Transcript_7780/m.18511 type:complete len:84 (-) Transcript_7780:20-271(-)|eukprot:3481209-Prymnesium_polylepis.3
MRRLGHPCQVCSCPSTESCGDAISLSLSGAGAGRCGRHGGGATVATCRPPIVLVLGAFEREARCTDTEPAFESYSTFPAAASV